MRTTWGRGSVSGSLGDWEKWGRRQLSQPAALFVTAAENAANATTASSLHYHLGMRDAFEAVFRGCYGILDDDALSIAYEILDGLSREERAALVETTRHILKARRRETVHDTLRAGAI